MMGGQGSGTLRVQRPMADWYRKHHVSSNAVVKYQYGVKDKLLMQRAGLSLEDMAMMERTLPRLDMLVIEPDEIRIVELKPSAQLRDVGQALQYAESLKRDVYLAPLINRPIKLVMVALIENMNVRALVEGQGGTYLVIPLLELPMLEFKSAGVLHSTR